MKNKDVLISWDKNIFDGEKVLLPNSNKLYTQIHNVPSKGNSWSIVFDFKETARIQGYKSQAKAYFLVDEAPHDILKPGFKFDFLVGGRKVGKCEIITHKSIGFSEIQDRLDLIEDEKTDFRHFIHSINLEGLLFTDEDLRKVVIYSNEYPYLFSLVLKLNKEIAFEYLEKYFFNLPIQSNAVYHSNLPLFLFNIKDIEGKEGLKNFISRYSNEVKNNGIIVNALKQVL